MSGDQDHRTEHYNFIFHDEPSPFFSHKPSSGAPGGGAYYDVHDALLGAAPSTTSFLSITDLLRSSMVDYTAAAAAASAFGLSSFPSEPPAAAVGTVGSELMLDANTLSAGNIPPPPTTTTLGCGGGAATPLTPNSSSSSSSTEAGAGEEEQLKQDQEEVKQQPEEAETEGDMSKKLDKPKKKGEKRARDPSFAFVTQSEVDHLEDGYRWRKYGQKAVKNSPYPRSYYRCTTQKCPVKKRVERCYQNPLIVITTYEGRHTHHCPATLRGSGYLLPPPPPMPQVMPASFCHDLMMQQVLQRLDDDDKFSRRDGSLNPSVLLQNLPPSLQHLPFQDYGFFHG